MPLDASSRSCILLKGDVLVMRMGSFAPYVNMRDRDTILADWLIKK